MQSIISDDQFYARSVSNLARLQNRQTRSKIGPNSGPLGQMMTTQPSAHQVVLHMVRKSGGNSFTAMEILRLFALWQNVILQTWFMSQIRWRNAKFFQSPPLRKFPKAHIHLPSIQLDRTMTIWNTPRVREASWLLRDLQLWASEEADYNPFPGRILLQTRPTLCAYDTFHYITTYSIVRIMIFVHICWSPFFVEKANVSILPAFKK